MKGHGGRIRIPASRLTRFDTPYTNSQTGPIVQSAQGNFNLDSRGEERLAQDAGQRQPTQGVLDHTGTWQNQDL